MKRMVMVICALAAVPSFGGTVCGLGIEAAANRAAIQREIDAVSAAGGGRVVIPKGEWPCGSLELKSGVELHVAKGAVLKGGVRQADYNTDDAFPENFSCKDEEWSGGHLIYAYKAHDVAITGEGVIDGNGPAFYPVKPDEEHRFPWYKYGLKLHTIDRTWHRPGPMVAMFLAKNIRLEGVTLRNTPCWTAHFRCCEGLVATNVTIDADRTIANSDGFSIDCTRKVRVSDCRILTGDDGFAIRASCTHHAKKDVCGDILIENCDVSSCCYGIRFGVGTGTIRGVEVRNCRFLESAMGFGFTTAWRDTGGRNCYIEDITIRDTYVGNCAQAFEAVNFVGDCRVANVLCENCRFEALLPCVIRGNEKAWPKDISFKDCTLRLLKRIAERDPGTLPGWMPKRENTPRKFLSLSGKSERVTETNCRVVDRGEADAPLIAVRHSTKSTQAFVAGDLFSRLGDIHRRHPGSCDEVWLCWSDEAEPEQAEASGRRMATLRPAAEKDGVLFSFQQGVTLGHDQCQPGTWDEEDLQVDREGRRIGFPCPRSPRVCARQRAYAKAMLETLRPSSYWLDDDLRLGVCKPDGCFCPRCLAAFNAQNGLQMDRTELTTRLFGKELREPLRAAWCRFNAESLACYAEATRLGAEDAGVDTLLGYQAVWSDTIYTGRDYRPILAALSGPSRRRTGIRPGALCYSDADPREMVIKCLSVAREAERCRGYGLPLVVCYEQENFMRQAINKSPGAVVTESALALASGADMLSEYCYDRSTDEPLDYHERFAAALSRARPYLERLAASSRRTSLGGVARFLGSGVAELPYWDLRSDDERTLAFLGVPVTVEESSASNKVWFLNRRSEEALTAADRERLVREPVANLVVTATPTHAERQRWLDELDRAGGGAFPVRIDRALRLRVLPRIDGKGRTESVTLLNCSVGETEPFELRVRNPAAEGFELQGPGRAPVNLQTERRDGEWVVQVPTIGPWEIVTVFSENVADGVSTGQAEIAKYDSNMAPQGAVVTNGVKWIDGRQLPIEGRAFDDTEHYYDRLPANVTTNVNGGVRAMKHHTAGMQFRFVTDSTKLAFKWVPYNEGLAMDHMPSTGVSGIDVYRFDDKKKGWRYVATGRIWDAQKGGELSIPWQPGTPCLVNLPLYNGIRSFSLGVDPEAKIAALPPRTSGIEKPVVFYGTSITHGGCCSRPGMAFPSIVGRHLDVPIVNLGFSGSGHGELEMSEHLAKIDASCYVIDSLWNMDEKMIEANYERFVRNLRRLRPDVPIILTEGCDVYCGAKKDAGIVRRNVYVKPLYERLVGEGWKRLYVLSSEGQHADDIEGTVDGVHPNDWGMMHIAQAFEGVIRQALFCCDSSATTESREAVRKWFFEQVYGFRPPAADAARPTFSRIGSDRVMMAGAAVRRRVCVTTVGPFGTNSFAVTAFIPTAVGGPVPAFLLICNRDPAENIDPERIRKTEFWPPEELVRRGYAAIAFHNEEIAPDCAVGNSEGVFACFEDVAAWRRDGCRPHDAWGTLSAWAWGASRVMDWIETEPRIDARRVAVVGHSRGGKTALLAGVTDTRFAMACVNDSGCGGTKLNRMGLPKSEHILEITRNFPYWFCANYRAWVNRDSEVPFDQDRFLALMAPRLVAVGSAAADDWAGPAGERWCCELARSAWDDPSKVDYHVRPGGHDLNLIDWTAYMDFADRQWSSTDKGDSAGGL